MPSVSTNRHSVIFFQVCVYVGNEDKRPTHSQYYRPDLIVSRPEIEKSPSTKRYAIEIKYPSHTKLT